MGAVPGALQGAEAGGVAAHTNFFLDLPVLYKRCQMSCPSITMACLSAFIVAHHVANMAYNAVDRDPKLLSTTEAYSASPLPLGANFFVMWLGTVLYVAVPFNAVACIHRFNHFKKYGGGFK